MISCHKEGLATQESFVTEFHDSDELVENSVPSRRDSLIDQEEMGNLGFLRGASDLGAPIQFASQ